MVAAGSAHGEHPRGSSGCGLAQDALELADLVAAVDLVDDAVVLDPELTAIELERLGPEDG
jgi:hypothetical protein